MGEKSYPPGGITVTNRERRDARMAYIADEAVFEDIKRARRLTHKLNTMDPEELAALDQNNKV